MRGVFQLFIFVLLAACVLSGNARKDAFVDDANTALEGPRRKLLGNRRVSGKVRWSDDSTLISGAIIKAYDNDPVGRDYMGQAISGSDGSYSISYTQKDWDFCCFSSKNPDIKLEVWYNGRLYYTSPEYGNINSNIERNLAVPRHVASGTLKWYETCTGAKSTGVKVYDDDIDPDDLMGSGLTDSNGYFKIIVPREDGGSGWDIAGGRPDPQCYFYSSNTYATKVGETPHKSDVSSTYLDYGTTTLWRGDTGAAQSIYTSIRGDTEDYVTVTEYAHCTPKKMLVTVKLDAKKAFFSTPSNTIFNRAKTLISQGISENWSRTGTRAITVNGVKWDVYVRVSFTSSGYSTSIKQATGNDYERSHNIGATALGLDMTLWYNEGFYKKIYGSSWQTYADKGFADTAAHEWGHTVLQQAISNTWSWTHKGSTTLLQEPSGSATFYPATGEIDIMKYYKDQTSPPEDRTFATEIDVKNLISIGKPKRVVYCGSCQL